MQQKCWNFDIFTPIYIRRKIPSSQRFFSPIIIHINSGVSILIYIHTHRHNYASVLDLFLQRVNLHRTSTFVIIYYEKDPGGTSCTPSLKCYEYNVVFYISLLWEMLDRAQPFAFWDLTYHFLYNILLPLKKNQFSTLPSKSWLEEILFFYTNLLLYF